VTSAGATHVIDRNADIPTEVAKILTTPPKIIFIAAIEPTKQVEAWKTLAPGGMLCLATRPSEDLAALAKKETDKKFGWPFGSVETHRDSDIGRSCASKLTELLASRDITVR
jgi:hypothetical protein